MIAVMVVIIVVIMCLLVPVVMFRTIVSMGRLYMTDHQNASGEVDSAVGNTPRCPEIVGPTMRCP